MNEHCYSEMPLKTHGRTLLVPFALAGAAVAGAALNIEPIETYLPWILAAIGAGSAIYFGLRAFRSEQQVATLRINQTTLTFHSGGVPMTLFWREVFGVEVGQVADARTGFMLDRIKIIARKAGTRHQDLETILLDQTYGEPPLVLRDILRQHWHEALDASRTKQVAHAVQFDGAPRSFGRRATDRI